MISDPNVWRTATVTDVIRESPRAATLRLDVPDWPGHLAGQRVDVRLTAEDGYSATRAYSMSSPPSWPHVDITVEELMDGEVSPYLVGVAQVGDELEIRGPIGGAFTWEPSDGGPVLLVGGGSGVVPLMAMVRAHAEAGDAADLRLVLSARTLPDALFRAELEALGAAGTIRAHLTLTRAAAPPGWTGSTRRVDDEMLMAIGPGPSQQPQIYLCGPTGFVEVVTELLIAQGHDPAAIRTERFGPNAG